MGRKKWLAERKISSKHWRCAKCLVKHYIAEDGWECAQCELSCEPDRIKARQVLKVGDDDPQHSSDASWGPKTKVTKAIEEDTGAQYDDIGTGSVTGYSDCDACQNTRWFLDENGVDWVACHCRWGGTIPRALAIHGVKGKYSVKPRVT
jgi:hypothetical protein